MVNSFIITRFSNNAIYIDDFSYPISHLNSCHQRVAANEILGAYKRQVGILATQIMTRKMSTRLLRENQKLNYLNMLNQILTLQLSKARLLNRPPTEPDE